MSKAATLLCTLRSCSEFFESDWPEILTLCQDPEARPEERDQRASMAGEHLYRQCAIPLAGQFALEYRPSGRPRNLFRSGQARPQGQLIALGVGQDRGECDFSGARLDR